MGTLRATTMRKEPWRVPLPETDSYHSGVIARLAATVILLCGAEASLAQAQAPSPAAFGCDSSLIASALDCAPLVAVPSLPRTSGTLALLPAHSPFGVAVTADGRPRFHLVATIAGLPDPRSLGNFSTYIAWGYTLSLDSAVKLGVVTNGRVDLGEIDRMQFRVLISAERSPSVATRTGALVLRGTSPASRLLAHRDLLQPSAPGALVDAAPGPPGTTSAMRGMAHDGTSWPLPPVSPRITVMPGMNGMVPEVAPFLPGAAVDPTAVPVAKPREIIHLANDDTLTLEARIVRRTVNGTTFLMYGFNGEYPGPLVEVPQGATIVVRYRNATDQPSAVHWHGVRLDNRFDGAVGITQTAVAPAASFTYVVHFPDAGIYWYHPHVREDIQQGAGLYGNMLVRSSRANYYAPADREEVLALDDLLFDARGLAPWGAEAPTHALMGRFGNVFLVNGEPRYQLDVKRGEIVRFFLTNVSSARVYNVSFGGARMKVVGTDVGKFEREEWVRSVAIAPAERYIVDVEFSESGMTALTNRVQALDHMIGSYSPETDTLGFVRVAAAPPNVRSAKAARFASLRRNADVEASIALFRKYFGKAPDHMLTLSLRTHDLPAAVTNMLQGINAPVEWNDGMPLMNWMTTGREIEWVLRDAATGRENMDIDWHFRQGDVAKIRIFNDPATSHAMAHPIHLHGQRFLVLTQDGVASTNLAWKDTALIPAGETVDLLVDMSNPGRWMLHCHIAEHLSAGMMAAFTVEASH